MLARHGGQLLLSQPTVLDDTGAADLGFRLDLELPAADAPTATMAPGRTALGPGGPGAPGTDTDDGLRGNRFASWQADGPRAVALPLEPGPTFSLKAGHTGEVLPAPPTFPTPVDAQALLRRHQDRERAQRRRRSRRIAHLVLLAVVVVVLAPTAAALLLQAATWFGVTQAPLPPRPTPSVRVSPTPCPALQQACSVPAPGGSTTFRGSR